MPTRCALRTVEISGAIHPSDMLHTRYQLSPHIVIERAIQVSLAIHLNKIQSPHRNSYLRTSLGKASASVDPTLSQFLYCYKTTFRFHPLASHNTTLCLLPLHLAIMNTRKAAEYLMSIEVPFPFQSLCRSLGVLIHLQLRSHHSLWRNRMPLISSLLQNKKATWWGFYRALENDLYSCLICDPPVKKVAAKNKREKKDLIRYTNATGSTSLRWHVEDHHKTAHANVLERLAKRGH